jgi:hypothetical protein
MLIDQVVIDLRNSDPPRDRLAMNHVPLPDACGRPRRLAGPFPTAEALRPDWLTSTANSGSEGSPRFPMRLDVRTTHRWH